MKRLYSLPTSLMSSRLSGFWWHSAPRRSFSSVTLICFGTRRTSRAMRFTNSRGLHARHACGMSLELGTKLDQSKCGFSHLMTSLCAARAAVTRVYAGVTLAGISISTDVLWLPGQTKMIYVQHALPNQLEMKAPGNHKFWKRLIY